MLINKAVKEKIKEVIENYERDELDYGFILIDDVIDDLNFIIDKCTVKKSVYIECVKQLNRLSDEGIIEPEDKDYAISQLYS
jgi:hypothetical protein